MVLIAMENLCIKFSKSCKLVKSYKTIDNFFKKTTMKI